MRGFCADEDSLLMGLVDEHGPRWKTIAGLMSGSHARTAAMVRNRWLRVQKGKKRAEQGLARNKCGQCGQIKQGHVCTARTLVTTSGPSVESLPPIAPSVLESDGLRLGSPPALTFDDAAQLQENAGSVNRLQLLAPPVECDSADGGKVPPIAASYIFSGADSSPAVAPSPGEGFLSASALAASLLAPTPEGGLFSFPTPPATSAQQQAMAQDVTMTASPPAPETAASE